MHDCPDSVARDHYPVVVVGAGPTGLTLANLLARYGTRALLVERNPTTVQEPRAVSIDDEALRTMQAAGIIDAVLPDIVAGYGSDYLSPRGRMFMRVEPTTRPYGYPRRNAFRQPRFEATLRDTLEGAATIDTLFGHALESFEQDEAGVTLLLAGPEGQRQIRCDYLVAADGARSAIRTHLGLALDGETFSEQWLIVDLEDSPAPSRNTIVFCDPDRPCIALPGPNTTRRFEFKLLRGEQPDCVTDQDFVERLLVDHGAAPGSRICRKAVYTFHARLAPLWSVGRVFLAGDACHLTPPFAGQGMNSCIRDAHNLAWKLAWVTRGALPRELLDTYERERRGHVGEMIQLALRMGRIMGPRNHATGFATRSLFRLLALWPAAREYFAQMKYKPAPRFTEGLLIPDGATARKTAVGRLLPQPTVEMVAGKQVLLDELLGDGFALVGIGAAAARLAEVATLPGFAGLAPRLVAVDDNGAAPAAEAIARVRDTAGTLGGGAGKADRILLVRPDRYVLAAFTPLQAEAIAEQLVAIGLGRAGLAQPYQAALAAT
ncbi:bifunctional 3-(3-hydroxy-phenyl)propionate/3-hydroxycinnamic acid hydroxylase [Sphingomonas sp. 22176]|uniref:bifunctional 3-(3-hydroxy-phenyl)propionate/3-hydroxycinnamic acid hydroxylase n=1 Tax=Sphingomonas sp. 22176 TaxID=3453884 RepID=UPI003F84C543